MCEACDNPEGEPECDGCGCCQSCCNCSRTDCDCDSCVERREAEAIYEATLPLHRSQAFDEFDDLLTGPMEPGFVHEGP